MCVSKPTTPASSGNMLEITFLVTHPRPTEPKALEVGPRNLCFNMGTCFTWMTIVLNEHKSSFVGKLAHLLLFMLLVGWLGVLMEVVCTRLWEDLDLVILFGVCASLYLWEFFCLFWFYSACSMCTCASWASKVLYRKVESRGSMAFSPCSFNHTPLRIIEGHSVMGCGGYRELFHSNVSPFKWKQCHISLELVTFSPWWHCSFDRKEKNLFWSSLDSLEIYFAV